MHKFTLKTQCKKQRDAEQSKVCTKKQKVISRELF